MRPNYSNYDKKFDNWFSHVVFKLYGDEIWERTKKYDPYGSFDKRETPEEFVQRVLDTREESK